MSAKAQTKTFGKSSREVPASADKAKKWYNADDEPQAKDVSAIAVDASCFAICVMDDGAGSLGVWHEKKLDIGVNGWNLRDKRRVVQYLDGLDIIATHATGFAITTMGRLRNDPSRPLSHPFSCRKSWVPSKQDRDIYKAFVLRQSADPFSNYRSARPSAPGLPGSPFSPVPS